MIDYLNPADEALTQEAQGEAFGGGEEAESTSIDLLMKYAQADGDLSNLLSEDVLATLGNDVKEDWERDNNSRSEWVEQCKNALDKAAQSKRDAKDYPWASASNVQYPILTVAAQQFAARAYPAIVKGDEAVGVKVLGTQPPTLPQDAPPEIQQMAQQAGEQYAAKQARAKRVKTWLNYSLFYKMPDWEGDMDILLNQVPITGMGFKKVYFDPRIGCTVSEYVNPLRLTVPCDTVSLEHAPRITHDFDLYPYQIVAGMRSGLYREFDYDWNADSDEDQKLRIGLEQYRLHDLDGDGVPEPYIVTVDSETCKVLRIEADYSTEDIKVVDATEVAMVEGEQVEATVQKVVSIKRKQHFVAFPFMPDPKGRFYAMGFGQLLAPLTDVINTALNELIDAGHAQNAGGGFIASGLRIQGAGQTNVLRFKPGEFKVVNSSAQDLRGQIFERTVPQPSQVLYNMLELVLGAAKDISAVKDVLTGEANSNAPVGTTLALIEQGLQTFTALYKRIYRSLKQEFKLIYECEARYGNEETAEAYKELLDDPRADFTADFNQKGDDIVPVSDPTVVTKAQALAKAQVVQNVAQALPGVVNPQKAALRIFQAADIDNPEELIAQPAAPSPVDKAQLAVVETKAKLQDAQSVKALADADKAKMGALKDAADAGATVGEHEGRGLAHGAFAGGMASLEEQPGDPMGGQGLQPGGGSPEAGVVEPLLGTEPVPGGGINPAEQGLGPVGPEGQG